MEDVRTMRSSKMKGSPVIGLTSISLPIENNELYLIKYGEIKMTWDN